MTVDEFATSIKAKYPQYQALDNAELARRVVAKYPVYASQVDGYAPQAAPAPPPVGSAGQSLSYEGDHGAGLQKLGDAVTSFVPGGKIGQAIGTLGGYGVAAFTDLLNHLHGNPSTLAKNYDLSAPSPLQVTGDAAKAGALVGTVAAPGAANIGEAALQGAILGGAGGFGQSTDNTSGNAIPTGSDIATTATGAGVGAAGGAATGAAIFGIGKLIGALGDKITNSVIKPSTRDIQDGFSIDTVKKYDLGGSLSTMYDKTESKLSDLSAQLNQKLASSPEVVDLNSVYQQTADSLAANKAKGFGSNSSIGTALEQLQAEIQSLDKPQVSIPEAQLVKQASGKMGAWMYGAQDPLATAREKVYNAFYSNLKTAIENNSPAGVQEINRQISDLIPVQNAIVRRIPIAERNNALGLGDMIGLVGSAMNPHALAGLGISLAQKSGTVGHLLSRFAGPAIQRAAVPLASGVGTAGSALVSAIGSQQ